jgi:hypothetical protein
MYQPPTIHSNVFECKRNVISLLIPHSDDLV